MAGTELAIARKLVITFNRIWQRCSSQSYAIYLKRDQQRVSYKNLNRMAAMAVSIITLFILVAVTAIAWQEVVTLAY
jgi:hypothetical protein